MTNHEQPRHCKVLEPCENAPLCTLPRGHHGQCTALELELPETQTLELTSGDTVAVGVHGESVLLSLDDVERTLPTRDGELGYPTARLTLAEATWLEQRLRRAVIALRSAAGENADHS